MIVTNCHNEEFGQKKWESSKKLKDYLKATILDKTVEKIVYYRSIFLNIVAVPVLTTPPSPESNVVVYSKESLIPGHLKEATLNWGKGMSFRKGVVLEIVLLRRKADMMGKTFSSSFVRDCSNDNAKIKLTVFIFMIYIFVAFIVHGGMWNFTYHPWSMYVPKYRLSRVFKIV